MRVTKDLIYREIAGDHLLIPTGATALKIHGMITVTDSGVLLFQKLQNEDTTMEELVDLLLGEYDVDEKTAKEDVAAFLGKMKALGILEEE